MSRLAEVVPRTPSRVRPWTSFGVGPLTPSEVGSQTSSRLDPSRVSCLHEVFAARGSTGTLPQHISIRGGLLEEAATLFILG